jgi:hypothetical protein
MPVDEFKKCRTCGSVWESRESFLADPALSLGGYQVNFRDLELGFLLFHHQPCHSTLAINPTAFRDLYDGPVFRERRTGSADCPGYCLHEEELRACLAYCECAFVREIMQTILRWPKQHDKDEAIRSCG